jgi:hypothetical protein
MDSLGKRFLIILGSLCFSLVASGQSVEQNLSCNFKGELLRDSHGQIARYTSIEMKQRATKKTDLSASIKRLDFRSVVVLSVLVDESGDVLCAKSVSGLTIARNPTEDAVRRWKFKVAETEHGPVAYFGWLEFTLRNIDCGNQGPLSRC